MLRSPRPASMIAKAKRAWRQSLQVRVVTITLATSGLLVATFGILVGNMITNGLVDNKTRRAQELVTRGTEDASDQLKGLIPNASDPLAITYVKPVVVNLADQDQGSGVTVAIIPGDASTAGLVGLSHPLENAHAQVPDEIKTAVREQGFVHQRLDLNLDGGGNRLYLVFGRELKQSWGIVQLYYFFPLDEEISAAALVTNTITITGIALVVMLALVVSLVTRMVVNPVRVAARTAQRLSNGLLDQRMEVKGEDDLAALAASFNHMAENLQRHILRLEEMSRLQRRFTSDVSHELRTPLTTVRMAADLLFAQRDEFDAPTARSAELLQAELDRFESLLSELLEISRFDAGFAALDAEPVNLGPLVRRAVDRLAAVADRAGVRVDVDVPTEPIVAEVDMRRVERILRNLIGNAIEHGEGKPVKVRLAASDDAVAITVRDRGVGLKPGEEKMVFNRFWRADPSRARQTGGTGLGLSIGVEDARLHGGWLEAWGSPGQGAQFRLTLPVKAGDRLVSSPLRLVPNDFKPPSDAGPGRPEPVPAVPQQAHRLALLPALRARPALTAGPGGPAGPAVVAGGERADGPELEGSQGLAAAPEPAAVGDGGGHDGPAR